MDYQNTIAEKMQFGRFLRKIPRGSHFRIIVSLSMMTDESYSKWQRMIKKLIEEDMEVELKHHEGIALKIISESDDPYRYFYCAANALRKSVLL